MTGCNDFEIRMLSDRLSLYDLALLLAEGQTGDVRERWAVFIDNLARITDTFARARAASKDSADASSEDAALLMA
ncbi:MAG: hypothetical protein KatS3mg115_2348 [Candidatus Poribacteria bacterium]|nr:MAG: hypothetical protein KatS3mg115_2348 [Candidatus Poribacteria bacterium]